MNTPRSNHIQNNIHGANFNRAIRSLKFQFPLRKIFFAGQPAVTTYGPKWDKYIAKVKLP